MSVDHERFISSDDQELERIRRLEAERFMEKKIKPETGPVHVTDADFDKYLKGNPLALIDFWASWCGPCRALAPTIELLAKEYAGKVFVGKLDVDENPEKAEGFNVFSVPTVLVLKDGREVDRVVGCVPKEEIESILKKHLPT